MKRFVIRCGSETGCQRALVVTNEYGVSQAEIEDTAVRAGWIGDGRTFLCPEHCEEAGVERCGYCRGVHSYDEEECRIDWEIRRSNTPGGLLGDPEPQGPGYHPASPLRGGGYD